MPTASQLDHRTARLVRKLLTEVLAGDAKACREGNRLNEEIRWIADHDYGLALHKKFARADIARMLGSAKAIWPGFNRFPLGPPSLDLYEEVARHLHLHLKCAPYPLDLRGFYVKTSGSALSRPLIYVNTAHPRLVVGASFCHEVGHHLFGRRFGDSGTAEPLLLSGQFSERAGDRVELAADILVSLGGYPKPMRGESSPSPAACWARSVTCALATASSTPSATGR
jgi:hypothetical protein